VPATVVGVLDSLTAAGDRYLVLPPSAARLLDQPTSEFYADVPGGLAWPAVHALNQQGLVVVSREVVTNPPPPAEYNPPGEEHSAGSSATTAVLALIVASVVIEVVLLAGPAFAVGVRRQRRDLALLAATGGAPADLRRVVLASGLVLGGGAAVLGGLLGIGLVRAAMLPIARWTTLAMGPFDVAALDVALTVAVGVLAGVAAAYVPARQAARTDIVATLTDRRGQIRTSWRSPLLGLLLATVGLVAVVLGARGNKFGVAVGAVVLVLGVVAATPWLVGLLAPLANRLPVAGRLAVRDATRNRSRTAPAIAAVMATVAGVTALAIASTSDSAKSQRDYLPSAPLGAATVSGTLTTQEWADITALLARRLPGRALARVQSPAMTGDQPETLAISRPGCSGHGQDCNWWPAGGPTLIPQSGGNVVVIDPAAARALYPPTVAVAVADGLERGRVVVLGPGALDGQGRVRLTALRFQGSGPGTEVGSVTLPAAEIPVPTRLAAVPSLVVVPPALLDRLPVPVATSQLVAGGAATPITATQEAQLREAVAGITPNAYVQVERGWIDTQALLRQILFALGAVLVLIATFTATGLTLTDARPDFATLAAVGAAPSTRRRMAMGTAAVIGISGALLGVLVGLAPGIAVAIPLTTTGYGAGGTSGGGTVIVLPWATLAGVTLLVPLLAVAITGLVVHSRLPMTRRTS
jgi:putative ABC transport system permease protein